MSYVVSTLHSVKRAEGTETYIYVIENHAAGSHKEWIDQNFHRIGKLLGRRAVIVKGYDGHITEELHSFLRANVKDDVYRPLEQLFYESVSFAITNAPLPHTGHMVICALPPPAPPNAVAEISVFFDQLADAISSGKLEEFLSVVEGVEFTESSYELPISDKGFRILSRLNRILLLQPNIVGIGINFNEMVDGLLKRYPRINA